MNDLEYFVGSEISRFKIEKKVRLHQTNYIIRMFRKFQMENCNPVATRIDCNTKLSNIVVI